MIHILHTFFSKPLARDRFDTYLALLPDDMRQRVLKFRRWQDAQASLFGKILLQRGAREVLHRQDILPEIHYSEFGRPCHAEGGIDFSISHSGNHVLCALSDDCRVGIDLEEIKPVEMAPYREQMTTPEWASIQRAPDPLLVFYTYWTRKEALVKARGVGLSLPLREVDVRGDRWSVQQRHWYFTQLSVADGFCCCLVTDRPAGNQDLMRQTLSLD